MSRIKYSSDFLKPLHIKKILLNMNVQMNKI